MACDQQFSLDQRAEVRLAGSSLTLLRGYQRGGAPVMRNMCLSRAFLAREAPEMGDGERQADTYKAKRDFEKTREPSGQDPVKLTRRRRFVIQNVARRG
jgi:hypothetical protein